MAGVPEQPISGHVFRFEGKRGPVWRAKYRLPDGRQVQRRIGPAWTERGRPRAGYHTKRTAEAWLRSVLASAESGTLPGLRRTGVTVNAACDEFLHFLEHSRQRKPSTLRDYASILDTTSARGSARRWSRTSRTTTSPPGRPHWSARTIPRSPTGPSSRSSLSSTG